MSQGFKTEARYDFLTIGGITYDGVNAPNGVTVVAGETIDWVSDGSTNYQGFTICFDLKPATPTNQYWTITGTGVQIGSEFNKAATECFTDGAGDYSNDEKAQITAMQSGTLISNTGEILFI